MQNVKMNDHAMAEFLRKNNVNWDNIKKIGIISEFYNHDNELILVNVYDNKASKIIATYVDFI